MESPFLSKNTNLMEQLNEHSDENVSQNDSIVTESNLDDDEIKNSNK